MYAYLVVTDYAVSFILVKNEDGIQRPVYYVSKSLQEVEMCYLPLEKAVLAIVHATRKLPYYFQAYTIVVLTDLDRFCGRVHRGCPRGGGGNHGDVGHVGHYCSPWKVYTDRASNQKGAGIRIVLITPEKLIMEKSLRLGFLATNNEAEYETLLLGLAMVKLLGGEMIELYSDSKLIVGQVNGDFEARDERIQGYLAKVQNA